MTNYCSECGFSLNGFEKFCPKCGHRVNMPENQPAPRYAGSEESTKIIMEPYVGHTGEKPDNTGYNSVQSNEDTMNFASSSVTSADDTPTPPPSKPRVFPLTDDEPVKKAPKIKTPKKPKAPKPPKPPKPAKPRKQSSDGNNKTLWNILMYVGLVLLLAGVGVGVWFYLDKHGSKTGMMDDEETEIVGTPRYPIVNVQLRTSPSAYDNSNKICTLVGGTKVYVIDDNGEWSKVRYVPDNPNQDEIEGYMASHYLVDNADYSLMKGIFGDAEVEGKVYTAKCRFALIDYFNNRGYVGKEYYLPDDEDDKDAAAKVTRDNWNQWQLKIKLVSARPYELLYPRVMDPYSKFTDFAFVLTNMENGQHKLVLYSFDDDETPRFIGESDIEDFTIINEMIRTSADRIDYTVSDKYGNRGEGYINIF